jgi:CheY-like chemotaxis protein
MEKKKILIVEDEGIIALDIKKRLESLGYDVSKVVDSGEKAIEEVNNIKPDLILMDIVLKGKISGMDASISIKQFLEIPIIYITSYFDEDYIHRCKCSHLNYDFLIKPFNHDELKIKVEHALMQ